MRKKGNSYVFDKHFTLDHQIDYFKLIKIENERYILAIITKK